MSLFCSVCKNEVPEGFSQCLACKAGFAPQLMCGVCRSLITRGSATCLVCQQRSINAAPPVLPLVPPPALPLPLVPQVSQGGGSSGSMTYHPPDTRLVPARLPSFVGPGALVVPEEYEAGKLGVSATVQIPPAHAAVMNDLGQLVALLHTMASKLVTLPGDGARFLAKSMRTLATDIQDEIERRVGPQS
jgi:hypothetical protein